MNAVPVHDLPGEHGDCFIVTAAFITGDTIRKTATSVMAPVLLNEKSPFRIVHGLPVHPHDPGGGRHWHAWVEATLPDGVMVLEHSNGHEVRLPSPTYYEAGQLTERHVWRYTPAEAKRLMRKYRHCGPWVPGWDTMETVDRDFVIAYAALTKGHSPTP